METCVGKNYKLLLKKLLKPYGTLVFRLKKKYRIAKQNGSSAYQ
jgi:hypothetical protein